MTWQLAAKRLVPPVALDAYRAAMGRNIPPPASDYFDRVKIGDRIVRVGAEYSAPSIHLFFGGHVECTHEMKRFLAETRGRKRLLDIGAAYGSHSLAFAIVNGGSSLAVDASPAMLPHIRVNLGHSPDLDIKPILVALSDKEGTLDMHFEGNHLAAVYPGESTEISVRCTTADTLCREQRFIPDAIKIDVEGHEVNVVAGLLATLRDHKPIVFLEVHPKMLAEAGHRLDELSSLFTSVGYSSFDNNGEPFPKLSDNGSPAYQTFWRHTA